MSSPRLKPGDLAPDFTLADQQGESMALRDLLGERALVLYFYPKDNTHGCTAEACGFRDHEEQFLAAGARVVGISSDSSESHAGFARDHRLTFPLLSDPGGRVRRLYGVRQVMGILPGRATFVIDTAGIVRHAYENQLMATKHVDEALAAVRAIAGGEVTSPGDPEAGSRAAPAA